MNNETTKKLYKTDDVIKTEDKLLAVLNLIAAASPNRRYPGAVADFADKVIETVVAHGCIEELRNPDAGEQSLLARLLHSVTDKEVRYYNPVMFEFATQIYEEHRFSLEEVNRILTRVLGFDIHG